jgi:amidase/aspartyl-tRNA(Asn)/glutamyl-tRNA(Gln) amidotransferase subunit A
MRPHLGLLTQPVSCIGLPVASVPVWGTSSAAPHLPIGVQLIAAPWREDRALHAAAILEAQGLCSAPIAPMRDAAAATATAARPATFGSTRSLA